MSEDSTVETTDTDSEETPGKTKKAASKNSKDVHGAEAKSSILMFDPEKLTLVDDPKSSFYDKRIKLPINDATVKSMLMFGVLQAIVVAKDPETGKTVVVDGRQRVKCGIEANRRLKAAGEERRILIPAVVRRGDEQSHLATSVVTNVHRTAETVLSMADKMVRLLAMGTAEKELAVIFDVSGPTVKNYLGLAEATSAVKKAVEAGHISVATGYDLSKLEAEEQRTKLAEIMALGEDGEEAGEDAPKKRKGKGRKVKEITKGKGKAGLRGKKELTLMQGKIEAHESMKEMHRAGALACMAWVLGNDKALKQIMD